MVRSERDDVSSINISNPGKQIGHILNRDHDSTVLTNFIHFLWFRQPGGSMFDQSVDCKWEQDFAPSASIFGARGCCCCPQ